MCEPKSDLEAIKHYYLITDNKVCMKCSGCNNSSQKVYSIHSASIKKSTLKMYMYGQSQSHILNQLVFSLTSNKTKLASQNAMLWQNRNLEGVSSCLN